MFRKIINVLDQLQEVIDRKADTYRDVYFEDGPVKFDKLSKKIMSELINHNMVKFDGTPYPELNYYFKGGMLHIVTDKTSWEKLRGRHWTMDMHTGMIELIEMN